MEFNCLASTIRNTKNYFLFLKDVPKRNKFNSKTHLANIIERKKNYLESEIW